MKLEKDVKTIKKLSKELLNNEIKQILEKYLKEYYIFGYDPLGLFAKSKVFEGLALKEMLENDRTS